MRSHPSCCGDRHGDVRSWTLFTDVLSLCGKVKVVELELQLVSGGDRMWPRLPGIDLRFDSVLRLTACAVLGTL